MPKIAEIETTVFHLPMKGALSWGKSSRMDSLDHVLVRLISDTGHVGLAEAPPRPTIYGETVESIRAIIHNHLAPRLTGMPLEDVAGVNRQMAAIANNHAAKGAIDICLHECLAKSQGKSLLEYLNPARRKIKISYILGIADQAAMLSEAKAVYEQGVRVLKVKVGRNFEADIALIQRLQAEFEGSGLQLYADANEGLQPTGAQEQLQRLADLGILYVEESLPVELISERRKLRETNTLPLIADDSAFTLRDLKRELSFNTFDILNIKTARTGYYQSGQMLALARKQGKGVMVGSQASAVLGAIRAAMFAGLDGIDHPSELSFFLKLEDDIVNGAIEIKDGYIDLNQLAAITVDETKLAQNSWKNSG